MLLSGASVSGFSNNLAIKRKAMSSSRYGFSRKKVDPSHKNIARIREKSARVMPHEFHYKPKVSESFLEEWLDFPVDTSVFVPFSLAKMWGTWLLWNNKGMAGLDPNDTSIRARICSQISVLGTAAGLFLVIAIAGLLVPPVSDKEEDKIWLDFFGCIMFTASASLIFYIGIALTAFYPLIESLRDDIAFDAYETYQRRVGGFESYLFYVGLQLVGVALLVAAKVIYSTTAAIVMLGIFLIGCGITAYLAKEIFISLDPISAMHMGLTNDPDVQYRAELLSHFMLRKIPNSIVDDDNPENDVFAKKRESMKYEETRASQKLLAAVSPTSAHSAQTAVTVYSQEVDPESEKCVGPKCANCKPFAPASAGGNVNNDFEADELQVQDVESAVFQADTVTKSSYRRTYAVAPERAPTPEKQAKQAAVSEYDNLKEMFCGDAYLFQSYGLSRQDSTAAYENIVRSGCSSSQDLLSYLDQNKQARLQGVCNCAAPGRERGAHEVSCSSRVAAVWAEGLTNISIPAFHAVKIIQALQKDLK